MADLDRSQALRDHAGLFFVVTVVERERCPFTLCGDRVKPDEPAAAQVRHLQQVAIVFLLVERYLPAIFCLAGFCEQQLVGALRLVVVARFVFRFGGECALQFASPILYRAVSALMA